MSEKSIEEVYEDRNLLALAFAELAYANGWDAGIYEHDEWVVVFTEIPNVGQVSWHMRPAAIANSPLPTREADDVFDGHSRIEKNDRLREYIDTGGH